MTATTIQKPNFRTILRHYMPAIRRHWKGNLSFYVFYGIGSGLSSLYIPVLYKDIVDVIAAGGNNIRAELMGILLVLAIALIVYNAMFRAADYMIVRTQSKVLQELTDYCLEKLQEKDYMFYANAFTGSLVAKAKRFVMAYEQIEDSLVFTFWMSGISVVGSIIILWFQSWILGSVFVAWIAVYLVAVRFMVKWQIPKSIENAEHDSKITAALSDTLTNIHTVKMFGAEEREYSSYRTVSAAQERARYRAWMQEGFWNSMYQGTLIAVFNFIMLWGVIELWFRDIVSIGTVVLVQAYVASVFMSVWRISKEIVRMSTSLSNAYEMVEMFEEPVDIVDVTAPEAVRFKEGRVRFDSVVFGYEGNDTVLRDIDLSIHPGERIAVVGHSGAGKTTLVKLLLRFVDVTEGSIAIDGQDVRDVAQSDLRRHIAYVPQEPLLFHRSLQDNIAYARPNATREEVVEVAKRAQVHDFVSRLPDGYETLVGERGIKLSGGERQRVAIARAMLKEAPVVLLDEATSSLDSVAERKIQQAFDELSQGRTTIVIAHRLSTIRHMDRILVFDKGRIVEQGRHDELLAQHGLYADLWSHQVDGFIAA